MIASRLTHRAAIERNMATGDDDWGGPLPPVFQSIGNPTPCFAWSNASRELVDGAKTAMIEDLRAMFAAGADVRAADEITQITDRRGSVIMAGRLKVEGPVQFKHNHVEVSLQRIG